jgi:hypothetical protein
VIGRLHRLLVIVAIATLAAGCDENKNPATETSASTPEPSATTSTENSAPTPQPPFADIHGWIAYGDYNGIWAIDPARRHGGGSKPIQLSDEPGQPVAWSRDGSKLLITRRSLEGDTPQVTVWILNADGVEKRVVRMNGYIGSASVSPDGVQIIYSTFDSGIYLANADGGDARLLMPRYRRWYASEKKFFRTELFAETFSPDGSQIAYVDGMGDWGNSIRVMDADGSHVRVLVDWTRGRQKGGDG